MKELYDRLSKNCATVNQINRLHIALENRMTPMEWRALSGHLSESIGGGAFEDARKTWIGSLERLYDKAGKPAPEPFVRHRLGRHIFWFKNASEEEANTTLAVCFTGGAQRMQVPLAPFLQHFDARREDVILIRYPRSTGFRRGLEGHSTSFESMLSRLGATLPLGRYSKVVAIGVSGGALPAILTARRHDFDAVAAFGCGHPGDERWSEALGAPLELLMRKVVAETPERGPVTLVYGADSPNDRAAALAVTQLIRANQVEVYGASSAIGHNALHPVLVSGQLRDFFDDALFNVGRSPKTANTASQPVQRPRQTYDTALARLDGPRVFCIGFNKTGTKSMGKCFDALGLGPVAEPKSPYMNYIVLSHLIFQGDYGPALHAANYFRSFQDRPWNVWEMYKLLDRNFPGSSFILTERDPESWWNSVERWLTQTHKEDEGKLERYLHHLKVRRLDKDSFLAAYNEYNQEVKSYFSGRSDLLTMNYEAGDGWEKLCGFLKLPVPRLPFPHANRQ